MPDRLENASRSQDTVAADSPLRTAASVLTASLQTASTAPLFGPASNMLLPCRTSHSSQYFLRAFACTRTTPRVMPMSLKAPSFFGMRGAITASSCGGYIPASSHAPRMTESVF